MACLAPSSAHAYLDPGTGSMVLQIVLGGVAGALVIVKIYWARVRSFFSRRREDSPADTPDQPSEES